MRTIDLNSFLGDVRARKAAIGLDESAVAVAARRNGGARRTASKRAALARAERRAMAAGVAPVPANY